MGEIKKTGIAAAAVGLLIINGCSQSPTGPIATKQSNQGRGKVTGTIASSCKDFMGIQHCSIGQGNVSLVDNSLIADGFTSLNDGLTSSFQNTTHWSQVASIDFGAGESELLYSTLSSGSEMMSLNIRKSAQDQFTLVPDFIGSTQYKIQIYDGTTLVGEQDNVDAGLGTNIVIVWPTDNYTENSTEAGRANIVIVWPDDGFTLTLPNGDTVTGNKIRFSAENTGSATFDQVRVTGTVSTLEIHTESIQ